jgi:hypothetical protein
MRMSSIFLGTILFAAQAFPASSAGPNPLLRFVEAVNAGDAAGCLAAFTETARFIDLGNDFSAPDRRAWFCNEVVKANAKYTVLSEEVSGQNVSWTFDYRAGSYFLEGKGTATFEGNQIADLLIERR